MSDSDEPTNLTRFLRGIEIIREYDPEVEMSCRHGFIYIGNYQLLFNQMTRFERELMTRWGWVEGDESWAFFVSPP